MATTMLPFLYQTRTIQQLLSRNVGRHTGRSRALLHTSPARAFRPCVAGRYKIPHDPIPFELPPDLASEFNLEDDRPARDPRQSTMTPSEKRAFESIFREIASRPTTPPASSSNGSSPDASKPVDPINAAVTELPASTFEYPGQHHGRARSVINTIVGDAARSSPESANPLLDNMRSLYKQDPGKPRKPGRLEAGARNEALLRFPPSLRQAAKEALGFGDKRAEEEQENEEEEEKKAEQPAPQEGVETPRRRQLEDGPLPDFDPKIHGSNMLLELEAPPVRPDAYPDLLSKRVALERLRYDERKRVESKMMAAKTDFELWDVLEEEVFSMIPRLGLAKSGSAKGDGGAKKKKKKGAKKGPKAEADADAAAAPTEPASDAPAAAPAGPKLDLEVHSQLYAYHTVRAIKILDERFPDSPLTSEVLPRIKSLGLPSYVLGATSDFYAVLAEHLWKRHNDVEGVLNLYEDMRHAGIEFDHRHRYLLHVMLSVLRNCAAGKEGEFRLQLMSHPKWTALLGTRLLHWIRTVVVEIERRQGVRPDVSQQMHPHARQAAPEIAVR